METSTELAPLADQARNEYAKILSDPSHAMYEPLRRGDAKAENYVNELYRRAHGTAPVNFTQGITVSGSTSTAQPTNTDPSLPPESMRLSREESVAQTEIDTMLRRTFGDGYDSEIH